MSNEEIVSHMLQLGSNTSEAIYSITYRSILTAIAYRLGDEALSLSADDLQLAMEEVKEAICHNLNERDYIEMGLDAWEITRHL